jgi:hypothetical protein
MASGSLPHDLHIHGTTARDGGQAFAGTNLGIINYASNDNSSSKCLTFGAFLIISN